MESHFSHIPDPFGKRGVVSAFTNAFLATAIIKCWPLLLFFSAWATMVTVISHSVFVLAIQPTLLTIIGTVLGFVISYRTTSSFERYNEGRRLWSQIILGSRTMARTIWFHIPDMMPQVAGQTLSEEERRARVVIEKKTVLNLIEAFSVAVKHYLRGEEGVYYVDLYHLVKYLPAYALPAGLPSNLDLSEVQSGTDSMLPTVDEDDNQLSTVQSLQSVGRKSYCEPRNSSATRPRRSSAASRLPPPVTSPARRTAFQNVPNLRPSTDGDPEKAGSVMTDDGFLLPAYMPPKYHLFDLFPFSLLVHALTKRGRDVKGKKAARIRAKLQSQTVSHNLPLEISLYLSSYIAALQSRKVVDPPTATSLIATLNQLVDALTGLERILTTPIPFSYSFHLWCVTILYCLLLPFQIWATLKWLTIPGTAIMSFIFFGFLVAGEEIENPFGYDKNDLNLDHFTHNIIRNELRAITATPAPDPAHWAFSPFNDHIFASHGTDGERVTPEEWLRRGHSQMQTALATL